MSKFSYKAKDAAGQTITGTLDSSDAHSVSASLRSQGLFVIDVQASIPASIIAAIPLPFRQTLSSSEVTNFTRQLSVMISAGLTITEALTSLRNQTTSHAMEKLLGDVLIAVEGGLSFSNALSRHQDVFPTIYIAVVRSGETSGLLDKMLVRLADNLEKEREFRGKLKSALLYPIIILIGVVIVVAIMMLFVVPQMSLLYEQLLIELPLPTKIVVAISDAFVGFWYILLAGVLGISIFFTSWKKTEAGKYILDRFVLKLPAIGTMQASANLSEMTRTLGLLISSGTPIIDALNNVGGATKNLLYRDAIVRMAKKVEKGLSLASAASQEQIFPPLIAQMTRVGEETGKFDEVMIKMSTYFESETDRSVKTFATVLEPAIMAVLGVVVGFLMVAVILPIYNITQAL